MKKACLLILNFCLIFGLSSFWSQTASGQTLKVADTACQLIITPVSDHTLRITLKPYSARDNSDHLDDSPVLVRRDWPAPLLIKTDLKIMPDLVRNNLKIQVKPEPLTITLSIFQGKIIQELVIDKATGAVHFLLGDKPLLGLGGGGKGLDRRGLYDPMDNGHRSAEYQIYGSRLPIPFLIGIDGWALFFHRHYNGGFDLRTNPGAFLPSQNPNHIASYWEKHRPLLAQGIDGWWPDDGDVLPIDSRLSRHLIYYHGPLSDRPGKLDSCQLE